MQIRPAEISEILKKQIASFDTEANVAETGQVLSVGDGIARIFGLQNVMSGELVEFPSAGHARHGAEPGDRQCRRGDLRRGPRHPRRRHGQPHRPHRRRAGRHRPARPRGRCARQPDRRQGPDRQHRAPPGRSEGAGHHSAQIRARAGADRHQGDRQPDPDRPRPARTDHRRPPDRQDRCYHRHHHQPEDHQRRRRREQEALLHLRRDRPEALHRGAARAHAGRKRRAGIFHHRRRHRLGSGAAAVPRTLYRLHHGRVLPRQWPPRGDLLRRSVQAGRRLPPDVAAAAPPARPRSLSRRRVLSALAPAGTRRENERRTRRGQPDRFAGDRDPGRRRLGLHPDQRDFDHRRPDLPGDRAVLQGHPSGGQCRHLGLARRLGGADQGDEAGGRPHQAGTGPVSRNGGLRAVRLRP